MADRSKGRTRRAPRTRRRRGRQVVRALLNDSLDKVNDLQGQADRAVKELVAGRNKNVHETMLMMEKADMSFRLMMQVRNKVIDAYREVMRMNV